MDRIYVASGLENLGSVKDIMDSLKRSGWTITYDWTQHGSVQGKGNDVIAEVASAEAMGVRSADLVLVLLPGGKGTHTELGIAVGCGIPVLIHSVDPLSFDNIQTERRCCAFHFLPGIMRIPSHVDPVSACNLFRAGHSYGVRK
jgi:hypothetical protein